MRLQIEADYCHDVDGRMTTINEPDGGPAPRFLLGRTRVGNVWRVRSDLPPDIAQRMQTLVGNESPPADLEASVDETPFVDALSIQSPVVRRWLGPAYRFPLELPSGEGSVLLQGRCRVISIH